MNYMLRCSGCGTEYAPGVYSCSREDGVLELDYGLSPRSSLRNDLPKLPGIWRYRDLLPDVEPVSLFEGNTPLIDSTVIGPELGITLQFKDEGRALTGSFKDRAATVMLSVEKAFKHTAVVTASSGNAAGAIAAYAAAAGLDCYIGMFAPSREKLITAMSFNPTIFMVNTERESVVAQLTRDASRELGWAMLNTAAADNPYAIEGYKTIIYELYESLHMADVIVAPAGSGSLLIGLWKGLRELKTMKLIEKIPRLIGVQATGCSPIVTAFENDWENVRDAGKPETVAGGLVAADPGVTGTEALRSVKRTKGAMLRVDDADILSMLHRLPQTEGVFTGPSGVVSVAGVGRAVSEGLIREGEHVVCLVTESGFKDMGLISQSLTAPVEVEPRLASLVSGLKNESD